MTYCPRLAAESKQSAAYMKQEITHIRKAFQRATPEVRQTPPYMNFSLGLLSCSIYRKSAAVAGCTFPLC